MPPRRLFLLLVPLLLLLACGGKLLRPFKKNPGSQGGHEQPAEPPAPPPTSAPEPSAAPPPPPPPPPAAGPAGAAEPGVVGMDVPPPTQVPAAQSGGEWFACSAPPLEGAAGATDLTAIFRPAPAGGHGFLRVRGEDFAFEDGTQFRIWGTNIARGANAPEKAEAPRIAARLAQLGFNAVRLHLIDSQTVLFQGQDSIQDLSARQLDRLDFLLAELKKRGIYHNLNLYVWRRYGERDGVPTPRDLPDKGRWINFFHPDVIRAEQGFYRELLTHRNPYTGLRWVDDPALCMIELANENGMMQGWGAGGLDAGPSGKSLSAPYREVLDRLYNDWLKRKYRTTEGLRSAWSRGASKGRAGLGADESLERGTVRRTPIKEVERTSPARVEDTARFYIHVEASGVQTMSEFLRRELGVKVPILGTQNYAGMPSMVAQAAADWVDNHAYWGHPSFYEGRRAQSLLKARTLSWVQNPVIPDRPGPGGDVTLLVDTTDSRVAGKPYTISEWAGSKVNPHAWEVPLVFAAYQQFHDVDGLFQFAFAQEPTDWQLGPMSAHLTWSNVRPYLVLHAVAALAWRRGDVAPAKERIRLNYSDADIYSVANGTPASFYWWGKNYPSWAPYVVPFERALMSDAKDSGPLQLAQGKDPKLYRATSGELLWDAREPASAHVVIDAPRYQGIVGSLRQPAPARNLAVTGDGRAAIAVISLDGEPLARTRRALLAAVGEFRGRGEKLEDQGEWQAWEPGQQPIEMKAIRATLTLKDWAKAGQLVCYALDARGARAAKVPVQARGSEAVLDLQAYPYAWYELVAE